MKTCRHIFFIICLQSVLPVLGQSFSRMTLPNQPLLPVSRITNVLQDREGYFWYSTPGGGLCRDNGYQIDVIRNDRNHPGIIANNDIMGLAEDTVRNSILFSTWAGLYELGKDGYNLRHIGGRGMRPAFSIAFDRHGQLWACGPDSIFAYDRQLNLSHRLRLPTGLNGQYLLLTPTADGHLWALGAGQMFLVDKGLEAVTLPMGVEASCVAHDRQGGLWLGTGSGIMAMRLTGRSVKLSPTVAKGSVGCMTLDGRGRLWAMIDKRLRMFDTYKGALREADVAALFPEGQGLTDGIYADRDGNVWVYGQSPHTFILSPYNRDVIDEGSRFATMPRSIYCQMTSGPHIWVWQWQQPLMVYNRLDGSLRDVQAACPGLGRLWFGFSRTADGTGVWDGTGNGDVVRLWMDGGKVRHDVVAKVDSRVVATAETRDHKLFIGTEHNLYVLDLAKTASKPRLIKKDIGSVTQMQISRDGWVYFTIEANGMGRVRADGRCEQMLRGMILTDVIEDAHRQLWVAGKDGSVYRYDRRSRKLSEDTLAGNENGDIIYMMEADHKGHIWILSDQRLKEYNPHTRALRVFRCTDPDIRMDCFQNICLTDSMICLAGLGGYRMIKPSPQLDGTAAENIRPSLSGYRVNGVLHLAGAGLRTLKIKPSDTNLELLFTAFNITDRDHIRFACKLVGWDKEWRTMPEGANGIQYINLAHGRYKLLLKAADAYGRWSAPVELLTLDRLPAWYETWWFSLIVYALIITVIVYAIRFYMRRNFHRRVFLNSDEDQQKKLIPLSKGDEDFVERAKAVVEKHIADEDFDVEKFSSEMFMSRMNLYRRMQTIIGQSPSAYIRTMRLKRAAELIEGGHDTPLAEIATMTGFSSPAYFSKCFHDMYGVPPSQWGNGRS